MSNFIHLVLVDHLLVASTGYRGQPRRATTAPSTLAWRSGSTARATSLVRLFKRMHSSTIVITLQHWIAMEFILEEEGFPFILFGRKDR